MASTFAVTRNHLIFGLCLPLAVLLGYMLADMDDPASRLVVMVALGVLMVPLLMRWHYAALVLSWNMAAQPDLPGSPQLWSLMALLSLFFAVLNRSINPELKFARVPALTRSLVAFCIVVLVTAMLTGGIGLRILGSTSVGGRGYFYIFAAVAGFFALSSQSIPPRRANLYLAMFFLPGVAAPIAHALSLLGGKASFLVYWFFPTETVLTDDFIADPTEFFGWARIGSMATSSLAVFSWLLARYGVAGAFDLSRPWRLGLLLVTIAGMTFGGFRSALLLMAAIFLILFTLEGLWRTRLAVALVGVAVVAGVVLVGFVERMPLPVQRTLSILPIKVDPATREIAESSTRWRVEMWKMVLPQVPKYLLIGKGYSYSADDLFMAQVASRRAGAVNYEEAAFAGDYHNGPLSLVIPFGAIGFITFVWLMVVGARFLYTNYREGLPELRRINAFLLTLFLARLLLFFFIFGSLYNELYYFTGILGLSVALNWAQVRSSPELNPGAAEVEAA